MGKLQVRFREGYSKSHTLVNRNLLTKGRDLDMSTRQVMDITGTIEKGMWNYEEPFPKFDIKPLGRVPWVDCEVHCEVFYGLHSQTGTYLETPAHYYGNDKSYHTVDIPIEKLINIPCTILNISEENFTHIPERVPVTKDMLERCTGSQDIDEKSAVLIGTGWGRNWMNRAFLDRSPYFTYEAMMWLISKAPILIGTDFPRWENLREREGFFDKFYSEDILMLAPCVNLEKIKKSKALLTVLPVKISGTSCVPCRAVIMEEGD